jgi:hypothetical protein
MSKIRDFFDTNSNLDAQHQVGESEDLANRFFHEGYKTL